jgi:hypothetical protein
MSMNHDVAGLNRVLMPTYLTCLNDNFLLPTYNVLCISLAFSVSVTVHFIVGFEVLKAVSTKMAVFWVVAPDYTALQPRRQPS